MSSTEQVAVVDIGTSKVACVVASLDDKERVIATSLAYGESLGVNKGMITDLEKAAKATSRIIQKVENHLGISVSEVWINASGTHLESMIGQGLSHISPGNRAIKPQDIHQVLNHSRQVMLPEDREQILAIPIEFIVDSEEGIRQPTGLSASRLEVKTHIVTGSTSAILNKENVITSAGRRVTAMVPTAMCSGLGVLSDHRLEMGAIVIDLGAGTTDIAIFWEGALSRLKALKVGSDHVTSDIAQLLKCEWEIAEGLKIDYGTCLSSDIDATESVEVMQMDMDKARPMARKMLAEIIESRMKEIAALVASEIEKMDLGHQCPKTVVITGGGSRLEGTDQVFAEQLADMSVKCASPKVMGKFAKQASLPELATAIGLARYALSSEESQLAPVSGFSNWKNKISTIKSLFGGKS